MQHLQFLIDSRKCHGCNKRFSAERGKRPLVNGSVRKQTSALRRLPH